jgi:drug/metabolite transporter (DMT)-like permease
VLAALLYLGAGLGLSLAAPLRRRDAEAPLRRSDLPLLAAVTLLGGVAGPVLLMLGLARLSGTTASLLLNLETPFTILVATLFLGERLSARETLGAAAVIGGAAALTWTPTAGAVDVGGAALIAAACAAWAIDNGASQRLAVRDPLSVVRVKALVAGGVNLTLGLALKEGAPPPLQLLAALAAGSLGYGLSIVLHLLAVRSIGAARQAALFGAAPFIGALASLPLLGERLPVVHAGAGALMAVGVALVVRARHGHRHSHERLEHEHAHVHDAHHQHEHAAAVIEPHSHAHAHTPLVHDHPHLPDAHHRHAH